MLKYLRCKVWLAPVVVALALASLPAMQARGSSILVLRGDNELTVYHSFYIGAVLTDQSRLTVAGRGSVVSVVTCDNSTLENVSGWISDVMALNNSSLDLSGGSLRYLNAQHSSTVTFHARDFQLGAGLSLDGDRVLGTGALSGNWLDGEPWDVEIARNDPDATIWAIPEPTTLLVLALGGLGLLHRRRR